MMTRRRFLTVSAAFLSGPAHSATLQEWSGPALGTSGRILLSGASPLVARQVFAKVERTLRQVESQFSLYRESSLVRLNRTGWLAYPDPEMLKVFELADVVHSVTGGIFDPSIQPLWLATSLGGDVARGAGTDRLAPCPTQPFRDKAWTPHAAYVQWHRSRVCGRPDCSAHACGGIWRRPDRHGRNRGAGAQADRGSLAR